MQDTFDPVGSFHNLVSGWWKLVVLAAMGGLLGLGISFFQKPLYQAEATYHASIDFREINYENLKGEYGEPLIFTQFDEDLALQVVERALRATRNEAFEFAQGLDPDINIDAFRENTQIRRYLGQWYVRYRHEDPAVAQAVVNFWALNSQDALDRAQASETAETFVIVDLISLAPLPHGPMYHDRNSLVLASTMIGLLIGVIVVDFQTRFLKRRTVEV